MGIKIEKININNLGPISNGTYNLNNINLIFSKNEGGKSILVEFISRSLFNKKFLWGYNRELGNGKIEISGIDQASKSYSPNSKDKLDKYFEKTLETFQASLPKLLVVKSGETYIDEGPDGINIDTLKKLLSSKNILDKSDILPWEQVIVTKIRGDNWINRVKTFVIEGENNGQVEARGSLANFLNNGDLVCLISRTLLDEKEISLYNNDHIPIFDLGFDPSINKDNLSNPRLDIEYSTKKDKDIKEFEILRNKREKIKRFFLSSLILGLRINKTYPSCIHGSAEFPANIMKKSNIKKYQSVTVYNFSRGGAVDTYAVPTPPKIVLTTGAMARFAKTGEIVNVAAYGIDAIENITPTIIVTNGS
ncbi:MAG: aspartate 1-decarboxylase, partial [Bacteroidales bacterium]|nr:aspartate 1-decarboxylase [Bacteroidales bacterium]